MTGQQPPAAVRRRAAVLGHPIAHSLSPALHRAAYAELGLEWTYEAVDVTETQLPGFVAGLDASWVGLSLTMPLKEAVLPLLSEVEPLADALASVNTVVLVDGHRRGYNTDVTGMRQILRDTEVPVRARALVVGAGATARSAVAALLAEHVTDVTVAARRPEAVDELRERLTLRLPAVLGAASLPVLARESWPPRPEAYDVVVSTVPAAGHGEIALTGRPGLLVDVIYDPWPTPLAAAWERAGGQVVGGLELLVQQAVEQVVLMSGRRPTVAGLRDAGEAVLRARRSAQAER